MPSETSTFHVASTSRACILTVDAASASFAFLREITDAAMKIGALRTIPGRAIIVHAEMTPVLNSKIRKDFQCDLWALSTW